MVSVSFNPIGNWFIVASFALIVTFLTLWAYSLRMRNTQGRWRWVALGLRLAAVLLCVLGSLRPSVVFQEKKKLPATLVFLVDDSSSMTIADEVGGQKRWTLARKAIDEARVAVAKLGEGLTVKYYRFDSTLRDDPEKDVKDPEGRETAIGAAMQETARRESGSRIASIIVLSDGNNNGGVAPLVAARQLKTQQIPVVTVAFGGENAGSKSKDIAVRDLTTSPTVFVKNQLQIRGSLLVRGFAGQTIDVEMMVEDKTEPVAVKQIKIPEGVEVIPISGLSYAFPTAGEKRVTLRVKLKEGELIPTNNQISTYVSVLKGGLNVLFVQGPHSPWEQKFWMDSVATSPDIQADLKILRTPAKPGGVGELPNELFVSGRYDVYVLSDLAANFLTPDQQALLSRTVAKGAGLIMLGGLSSFGPGGWGSTELANVLPTKMRTTDGQVEPEGGIKFVPNTRGLDAYLLQIGSNREESLRIWNELPSLPGVNQLGEPKPAALIFGQAPGNPGEPIMLGMDGIGRVLAFGGETWVWARSFNGEGPVAHKKFWRQVIFWLAHKEDKGDNEIKLNLATRRISVGQKLELGVTSRDAKGASISGLKYDTKVERDDQSDPKYSERVDLFNKGEDARGTFFANQAPPGNYRVSVVASKDGKEVGRDSARFFLYQDDRELENPAADRALLRQIAETTGGESITPEQLPKYLQSLKGKVFTESLSQTEKRLWDNWPFLMLFATLLTMEWWLRKRHGWV